MIDEATISKVNRLILLLDSAYDHYFKYSDGYCKSSEGHVELTFGNYFNRQADESPTIGANVYSYVLGPSRMHYFDSLDEALTAVQAWYEAEMERTWDYE
jgi:hypothetical protein